MMRTARLIGPTPGLRRIESERESPDEPTACGIIEFVPDAQILCDYCRRPINLFSDDALLVGIHRRVDADDWSSKPSEVVSGDEVALRFCQPAHLSEYAARVRLPTPAPPDSSGFQTLAWLILAVAILSLAGIGTVDLIRGTAWLPGPVENLLAGMAGMW